jgi:hypothetical protein
MISVSSITVAFASRCICSSNCITTPCALLGRGREEAELSCPQEKPLLRRVRSVGRSVSISHRTLVSRGHTVGIGAEFLPVRDVTVRPAAMRATADPFQGEGFSEPVLCASPVGLTQLSHALGIAEPDWSLYSAVRLPGIGPVAIDGERGEALRIIPA